MHDDIDAPLLFVLAACLVTVACAPTSSYYVEPQSPSEQQAVIRSASVKEGYQRVSISTIDGRELEAVDGSIRVAPGMHYLKLFVSSSGLIILFGEVELRFDARARHAYEIGGTIEYGTARVWITDAETKQVIARGSQKIATTGGH
jgi:hypothetical protein